MGKRRPASASRLSSGMSSAGMPLGGKLVSMNSLSMPRGKFGGTTAVTRGGLADPKADKAAGKCSSSFSGVYKGTQPSVALNSSGEQSASRPFSSKYGIQ